MILPKDIKTRHKIRDAKILSLYASGEFDQRLIAKKFNLSQVRIHQILKANARLVLDNADWEKFQRVNLIKQDLNKDIQPLSKKDLIELWRKEYETGTVINNITQFLQIEKPSDIEANNRLNEIQTNP